MDVATLQVGRWVEGKLAERDKQGRPRHSLEQLLGQGAKRGQGEGFASLGMRARKVRMKEDGTWE